MNSPASPARKTMTSPACSNGICVRRSYIRLWFYLSIELSFSSIIYIILCIYKPTCRSGAKDDDVAGALERNLRAS